MNTDNSIAGIQMMESAAKDITADMNEIFAKHGTGCDAPEFMKEPYLSQWNTLYATRKQIFDYHARVDSIINDFARFYFQEVN